MPTAVVTGAARGLGQASAAALAGRGYTVHLTDIDDDAVTLAATEVGGGAFASALDVRDLEACRALAAGTAERTGSLDLWVNNAGVLATGLAWEQDDEARRFMLEVNALGTMNGTVAALDQMLAANRGHVINVISLAGLVAAPGEVAYSASKHAAIAFSIGTLCDLRRQGIRGIDVSALCPDGIWTPMLSGRLADPDAAGSFSGHLLTPEEAAEAVAALAAKPQPVKTVPGWRGVQVRALDLFPRLTLRMIPLLMRDAQRRQRRYAKRIESGRWPRPRRSRGAGSRSES